ncbi:helix-turn-helix domain-containing protein [Vibrio sp. D404a]|uniref:helix-turn-helix domain-containing protein n=1 Tax=unclassified Vibrio TaxID=2614977 RepID=UPI002552B953|nr:MULTISPECIES: helix-turn-helix transcriptional regulator [unclassified Vibrio]MDK9737360.1 helix-turn-helix domain-containing protein [Vibrio sp. D404a]MDK9797964.1 helix-turn-helix domain-containing protein [Vibrio sp. D449a]
MDKLNFAQELKRLREEKALSQEEMADILATSHRAFSGVNQVMVSQWERGKTLPSFVRRLGIASFFQREYQFSVDEMVHVKAATKLMETRFNIDIGYDYHITSVEATDFSALSGERTKSIQNMHQKLYGHDFIQVSRQLGVELENMKALSFLYNGVIIGHVIYDSASHLLCSLAAVSVTIRRKIFDYLAEQFTGTEFRFPTIDPAMCQFLYDLYFEPYTTKLGMLFFKAEICKVVSNPFSQNIQNKHDIYFKYLRYQDLKQKKKSVEFVIT